MDFPETNKQDRKTLWIFQKPNKEHKKRSPLVYAKGLTG